MPKEKSGFSKPFALIAATYRIHICLVYLHLKLFWFYYSKPVGTTVTGSPSCSFARQVALSNLGHFSMEMAEIWSPGTFFADIWTYKISALYLLYFQSYYTFSDVLSDFH